MSARAPRFWYGDPARPGWRARLLSPLGALYAHATARGLAHGPVAASATAAPAQVAGPVVICIGNLHAGGTGKTPTVIALIDRLGARYGAALRVHVVSRGHGGRLARSGVVRVDPARHCADEVGDEPLLLSAFAPVWVGRDRAAAVAAAGAAGAGVVLLDDGFQNPAVAKALSIVVVDAERGFGNGLCLPAGPLREPVDRGLARANAVLSIGTSGAQAGFAARWGGAVARAGCPHLTGALLPLATGMPWAGSRVLAFAGIGHPEKFFASLGAEGAEILRAVALSDHQPLRPALLRRMEAEATALGAQLVTTEKDAVRLPPAWRHKVLTLPVRLHLDDPGALDRLLAGLPIRA